jgi:hypothetical protein
MRTSFYAGLMLVALLVAGCATTKSSDVPAIKGPGIALTVRGELMVLDPAGMVVHQCYLCQATDTSPEACAASAARLETTVCESGGGREDRVRGNMMCAAYTSSGVYIGQVPMYTPGYYCWKTSVTTCTCMQYP